MCNAFPGVPDPDCPWVGWAATLDVGVLGAGSHVLEVTADDAAGRTITRSRSFVVE